MGDVFKAMMAVAHCGTRGHEGDDLRALLVELRAVLDREGWDFQPTAEGGKARWNRAERDAEVLRMVEALEQIAGGEHSMRRMTIAEAGDIAGQALGPVCMACPGDTYHMGIPCPTIPATPKADTKPKGDDHG